MHGVRQALGLPDQFGAVGEHRYLLEKYGLVARNVAAVARRVLGRK